MTPDNDLRPSGPYQGLQPYREDDELYFFGREQEIKVITSNLDASRLTVMFGPTGVGKSSLVMAGVLPRLKKTAPIPVTVFSRWESPEFASDLKSAIGQAVVKLGHEDPSVSAMRMDDLIRRGNELTQAPVYVVLDSFEQYFLRVAGDRTTFESELARTVNRRDMDVHVLMVLREDFVAQLETLRIRIPNVLGNMLRIRHLTRSQARDAIVKPLSVFNRRAEGRTMDIEDELVSTLIDELSVGRVTVHGVAGAWEAGEVMIEAPLLQIVLLRLWQREMWRGSSVLRLSTLMELGGAGNVLRQQVSEIMGMLPGGMLGVVAEILGYLVTPSGLKIAHTVDDLAAYTHRPAAEIHPVVYQLTDLRVLRATEDHGRVRFEVFHDMLVPALMEWRATYLTQPTSVYRALADAARWGWRWLSSSRR